MMQKIIDPIPSWTALPAIESRMIGSPQESSFKTFD
jgi:hypothetical protein